jgi:hypothetical protein
MSPTSFLCNDLVMPPSTSASLMASHPSKQNDGVCREPRFGAFFRSLLNAFHNRGQALADANASRNQRVAAALP